jgi:hypothetical protein
MDLVTKAVELILNTGSDEWITAFCQAPGLMAEEVLEDLELKVRDICARSSEFSVVEDRLVKFIKLARQIEGKMRARDEGYPFGDGPLEQLYDRHVGGHMGMDTAKQQARDLALRKLLHPSYLAVLSFKCVQLSYQGQPAQAIGVQTLILAAAGEMQDQVPQATASKLAVEFIRSAAWQLVEKGDARLFHQALDIGRTALEKAETTGERAELEMVLGILYLDPYAAVRTADWYRVGIKEWQAAAGNPEGYEMGTEKGLPFPADALAAAQSRLRIAVDLSEGQKRREAFKALVQALDAGRRVDRPPDNQELVALCDQALELLESWPDPIQHEYICQVRQQALQEMNLTPSDTTEPEEPADTRQADSLAELVRTRGGAAGVGDWATHIGLILDRAPGHVLELAVSQRTLFMRYATETNRETLWRHELIAMSRLAETTGTALWEAVKRALDAQAKNDEDEALEHLNAACQADTETAGRHIDALRWLAASMKLGSGSNAFNAHDYSTAANHYSLALQTYLGLEQLDSSFEMLDRLHEIVSIADKTTLQNAIVGLTDIPVGFECLGGDRALKMLELVGNSLIQRLAGSSPKLLGVMWAVEFAKSRIFRALLLQDNKSGFEPSDTALHILRDIRDLELEIGDKAPMDKALTAETLLGASYTEMEPGAGNDPASRLRNLRHTFDRQVTRERLLQVEQQSSLITAEDSIVNLIPETTVLFDIFNTGTIRLNVAYTSEGAEAYVVDDTSPMAGARVTMKGDTLSASFKGSALLVESLRKHICAEPGPFEVDRKARPELDKMLTCYLGHGVERLQQWWDMGKRHICFVPHGALHFLPLHLMHWNGRPLAHQWTVTYLPATALITNPRKSAGDTETHKTGRASLGLGYAGHPFLSPLDSSAGEVKAVARAMGAEPELDAAVTPSRLKQALQTCSYIHLSCHGKIDPEAPELQHLYLAPGGEGEEKLHAYEISALDLSHVELVSLSACQSGLGRFDQADNLRGLQANLFISGVRTVVDTLWDVGAQAAEIFFTTFYEQLTGGSPLLTAFKQAQDTTRGSCRAYRDWGAFRLSGKW